MEGDCTLEEWPVRFRTYLAESPVRVSKGSPNGQNADAPTSPGGHWDA